MGTKEFILIFFGVWAVLFLVYLIFRVKIKKIEEKKLENKKELDLIYKTFNHLSLSELEEAFSNADTQEKKDFFLKLYNLKLAENQMKVIQGDFIL